MTDEDLSGFGDYLHEAVMVWYQEDETLASFLDTIPFGQDIVEMAMQAYGYHRAVPKNIFYIFFIFSSVRPFRYFDPPTLLRLFWSKV